MYIYIFIYIYTHTHLYMYICIYIHTKVPPPTPSSPAGVGGASTGHDAAWDDVYNLRQRVADGVVAVTQANHNASAAARLRVDQVCVCIDPSYIYPSICLSSIYVSRSISISIYLSICIYLSSI